MARILIVEDSEDIASALAEHLRAAHHDALVATTGERGLSAALTEAPDLVVLDLMLPGCPGEAVLAQLRGHGCEVPILILSAKGDEDTKVRGLRAGADDYVTKPFGLLELMARIEGLLRRHGPQKESSVIRFGSIELRVRGRHVLRGSEEIILRPKEMDLLLALARQANQAVSRRELLNRVWGYDPTVESRTVDWHMAELRRKLESDPDRPAHLHTVRKFGYRLDLGGPAA
jgi:DNA-binding response OmpR family regulator